MAKTALTNAAAATDIRDIKPLLHLPSGWEWLGWLATGLLAAGLIWLAVRWWRRRRAAAAVPTVVIPPHARARTRLRDALAWLSQPKPFCILISDTLRVYLEERFEWRAPERTTEEFLDELQDSPRLTLTQKQSLADFLTRCDLVKFARDQPGEPELRELLEAALRLVEQTAPDALAGPSAAAAQPETALPPQPAAPV
jgi:hypothetical protein